VCEVALADAVERAGVAVAVVVAAAVGAAQRLQHEVLSRACRRRRN
jgi:hypothetical protein